MVSTKRLIIAETFFQEEVILDIDVKKYASVPILEILNAKKISINQSCGGHGTCGTCRCEIIDGASSLSEKSGYEKEIEGELQLKKNERLACQTTIIFQEARELKIKISNEFVEDK